MKKIDVDPEEIFCPQPMYVIGTLNSDQTANFSVITWIGFNWNGSPHLMLGVGGSKRTKSNIMRTGEFSANLVSCDFLKLADYFGNTKGDEGPKDAVEYKYSFGKRAKVPILESSRWIFECSVSKTINLDGSDIFIAKIVNIKMAENLENINPEMIDLKKLDPVIYAPYNYYAIGEKLGACGFWQDKPASATSSI